MWVKKMKKKDLLTLFFIILLAIIFGSVSIFYPYGRDQGIYAYIGNIILDGGLPYKDAWDFKPPGIYYIFALSSLLFGKSMISIRIFEIIWQITTALFISAIATKVLRRRLIGMIASSAYLFLFYTYGFWETAQSESFLILPLTMSIFCFLVAGEKQRSLFLFMAGFSLSIAVLFKYQFGILLVVMIAMILWHKNSLLSPSARATAPEMRMRLLKAVALVIGFSIPILIILVYFYANAALEDFITTEFVLASNYVKLSFQDKSLIFFLAQGGFYFVAIIALILIIPLFLWFTNKLTARILLVIAWAGTCLLSIILQGKFFLYHYPPLIAPLILMFLFFFYSFYERNKRFFHKIKLVFIVVGLLIFCFVVEKFYVSKMISLMLVSSGTITLEDYYTEFGRSGKGDFSLQADMEVADFIAKNTSSDEEIYIWGFEPIIYVLAKRSCISRFIYNVPLYCVWAIPEHKREFLEAVRKKRPKYFVVVKNDAIPWVTGLPYDSKKAFEDFVELKKIIRGKYILEREIEDFMIYRLK